MTFLEWSPKNRALKYHARKKGSQRASGNDKPSKEKEVNGEQKNGEKIKTTY